LKTTAVKKGDYYILNGSKVFITNGNEADTFITFAKTNTGEVSAFIIEKDFPGLKIGKNENKMGLRGTSTVELFFENCEDRKSTRLNSSHVSISYAVFCLKKKNKKRQHTRPK